MAVTAPTTAHPTTVDLGTGGVGLNWLTSSDVISAYAKANLDVDSNLFGRYGKEDLGISDLMQELGNTKAVSSNVFQHYEQDFTRDIIVVKTGYTPSASVTFTVDDASPDYQLEWPNPTTQTFYTSASSTSSTMPRVGDIMIIPEAGGDIEVEVTAKPSNVTFTATCTQTGVTIASGAEDLELFITGRAAAERGTTPDSRDARLIQYENKIQTIDEGYSVTGSSLGQVSFFNNMGDSNSDYWYVQGILNTRRNFEAMCDLQLLTGKKITSTNSAFAATNKTEGLIPFIENNGNVGSYTAGSFALTDIADMSLSLRKYYGASENLLVVSDKLEGEIDNLLRTSEGLKAGGVVYAGVGGQDRAVDLGFDSFKYFGLTYHKKSLQAFSDPTTLGSADSSFRDTGMVLPMDTTTAMDYGKQQITTPSLVLNYLETAGESMGYKEWYTGGAGIASTNTTDELKISMRKRMGFEAYGGNRFGIFQG